MKVVAFNGSPRPEGNTYHALRLVTAELEKEGIETEIICVGTRPLRGCMACGACAKRKDGVCAYGDDGLNAWVEKAREADGIILGSPVHFSGMTGAMKCFCDRLAYVSNGTDILYHKVGAAVAAVRRSGGIPTVDALLHYLTYHQMLIPASNSWPVIHGRNPGEVLQDAEGVQIMQVLGQNMAWLLKMREKGLADAPAPQPKIFTNFIR